MYSIAFNAGAGLYAVVSGRIAPIGSPSTRGTQAQTIAALLEFAAAMRDRHGLPLKVIIPGGGFGVRDDASGADVSIAAWADAAANELRLGCARLGLDLPELVVEPGRAIIGPAGVAVYTVGARKEIPGVRTYVSVDGGMSDNIGPSLYGAKYSAALASRDEAGAYCLAMSSNYRRAPRPAAVLVKDGSARLFRRRETYADMLRMEALPGEAPVAAAR